MSKILGILRKTGTIITKDHFVLTSGRHTPAYINKDALYPHTKETSAVGKLFAEKIKDLDVDTVVGPALGGIILSTWTAHHLSQIKGKEIFGVYTEKTADKNQVVTRGYDKFLKYKKVLIVEDLTSTGDSAKKVVEAVQGVGGEVVAVCVMVNRNPKEVTTEYFGVPFYTLDVLEVEAYTEQDCPMCKSNVPVNTVLGHGKKYLEKKKII
ncbi:MAG: phosphoribosyltransferase [Candidatus Doudnabacteria bacterium CG10_big_fil_rev_8_21_14_0_10_41_10]|uniref:Orotate phosphoribosyltransferase n=1 Tax=Candidatus Doudnabacteria bacterium CG10_big_fil_rev_8_21_14_0_10_41_10 TaxID=1974551 RepID=A0A2H0VCN3_9BACT|nr:MAG: phosphoribosyltransferase [Candidatus Doudnabacteria bacterium CG10_big_fil_rev_8_21_14_0_10_41_10]